MSLLQYRRDNPMRAGCLPVFGGICVLPALIFLYFKEEASDLFLAALAGGYISASAIWVLLDYHCWYLRQSAQGQPSNSTVAARDNVDIELSTFPQDSEGLEAGDTVPQAAAQQLAVLHAEFTAASRRSQGSDSDNEVGDGARAQARPLEITVQARPIQSEESRPNTNQFLGRFRQRCTVL